MSETVTAAMLAIGDELLSGRTKDRNIGHLADILTAVGIDLKEVRIVPDEEERIVEALNALRSRYTYVFTSGGIGPTHDDITADAVAKAFGLPCEHDAKAMELLGAMYARRNIEFTDARKRMARMPRGAAHIDNPVSTAPGFNVANVYVMAGVPSVFEPSINFLNTLFSLIKKRKLELPENSYTTRLFKEGSNRIIQKVGEEAVETLIAAKNRDKDEIINEVSDLVYHLFVMLAEQEIEFSSVVQNLERRHNKQ